MAGVQRPQIRKLEESDWFKGQVGVLLQEVLDEKKEDVEQLSFLGNVFSKRESLFTRLFCSGSIPDSTIRKALFLASDNGFDYWVSSKGWFWMGASVYDFAWKAAHPFFTREGRNQKALRALLDNPFFDTAEGSGKDLMESFADRTRPSGGGTGGPFGVVYYLNRYYDDFFERWTKNEAAGDTKCVGRILPGDGGLTMQMLDGKTRSSPYWDPYLYVALKHVDEESVKDNGHGAFKNLVRQYDAWGRCSVTHRKSQAEIWNDSCGVRVKASEACLNLLKVVLAPSIEMEEVKDEKTGEVVDTERLLRTRTAADKSFRDNRDRIEACEKLLKALMESYPMGETEGT